MKVFSAHSDFSGFLGVAKTFKDAIYLLIEKDEIYSNYEFWDNEIEDWNTLEKKFGSNWVEKLAAMPIPEFNKFFALDVIIDEEEIYEYEGE